MKNDLRLTRAHLPGTCHCDRCTQDRDFCLRLIVVFHAHCPGGTAMSSVQHEELSLTASKESCKLLVLTNIKLSSPKNLTCFFTTLETRFTVEVALLGVFIFWMKGLLNPKSSECHYFSTYHTVHSTTRAPEIHTKQLLLLLLLCSADRC